MAQQSPTCPDWSGQVGLWLVGGRGIEPPPLTGHGPKPCAAAITPPAHVLKYYHILLPDSPRPHVLTRYRSPSHVSVVTDNFNSAELKFPLPRLGRFAWWQNMPAARTSTKKFLAKEI